ncbi:MAG: UvrD-helicase domain-containing protein [Steroidobacteraceae bacterium]
MTDMDLDAVARQRAIGIDRSILLEAPAGSGKTTVLTQRLLALLADVDEPEQVLAITFTRKAAAEMRVRVFAALAGDIDPGHPQAGLMTALAARVHARSAARGWQLEVHSSRLRILTIDAFNFSLAARRPLAAGTGPGLAIADRPQDLYLQAARRALIDGETEPALQHDCDVLFGRLDNQWQRVETLLAGMLAKRAHWLPHVLEEKAGDLRARIGASLARIVAGQLALNIATLPAPLLAAAGELPGVGTLDASAASLDAWCAFANAALTATGSLRKRIDARIHVGYKEAGNKARLGAVIEDLAALPGAERLLDETRRLPPPTLTQDDGSAIDALSRVLTWAARHLHLVFAEAGSVDHVYVAGAARAALTDEGSPSELAIRTGQAVRHILVDEFQDTSIAQFALLEVLVQDWSGGDGRTLFVVGDPMQSIYQFREAEVGLFLRARDAGIGPVRLEALRLTRNFRSRPGLVAFGNDLFSRIFPAQDDMRAAAVRHTPSQPARNGAGEAPRVSLLAIANGSDDDEALAVVERVRALRAGVEGGRIAILVPARARAAPITARLTAAGYTVRGVDLVPLAEVPAVRDLVALLRALAQPGDRAAWLTVLRAPWCGLSLASLAVLSRARDPLLLPEALQATDRLALLAPDEAARAARVHGTLERALARFGREPPADVLESAWLELGGADCHPLAGLEAAREFLRALADASARGAWRGLESLEGLLADLYARSATDGSAIEIMTIHRAKGLEFEHVILPGFGRRSRRSEEPILRWLDLPRAQGESDLLMSPIVAAGEREEHRLGAYLKGLEAERREHEQLRLLYVAATRAKESLHWIASIPVEDGKDPKPAGGTLLAAAWPALAGSFAIADPSATSRPGAGDSQAPRLSRLADDWGLALPGDSVDAGGLRLAREAAEAPEFSWVRETARHIGTVVHGALEQWGDSLPASAEAIDAERARHRTRLARLGVPAADLDAAAETVTRALRQTFADPRGRWLFAPDHRQQATEFALTGLVEGRLVNARIDRSFIDQAGTRWVIDFKTSRHEGGSIEAFLAREQERYRAQLARYVQLAQALGPEPVRAALYFPLIGAFCALEPLQDSSICAG